MFRKIGLKNKRGGEKLLSIWWFFSLTIIGVVIYWEVSMFYSTDSNVKLLEADILSEKILDCVNDNGFLINDFFKEDFEELGIFDRCGLNKEIMEEDFYFKITINTAPKKIVSGGNPGFEALCGQKGENVPECITKKENILYNNGGEIKPIKIEVLTASNQKGKNVLGGSNG